MYNNILVPTDFSNNAFHALYYATQLFGNRACTFFLLNVYNEKKGFKGKQIDGVETMVSDRARERSNTRLERTVQKIKKKKPGPKHSYVLISEPYDLIRTINDLIDKLDIDLIVMGNKGKKSSIPVYLGSRATNTLQSVKKCPILTVPKGAEFDPLKKIAFATDHKNRFSEPLMAPLKIMAGQDKAAIRVLHIENEKKLDDFQTSNLDGLRTFLKPFSVSFDTMPNFISKAKVIEVFLKDSDIDLLAMVNNEHGFLEKMLREPIIEKVVFNIDIPFLVIPQKS